MPRWVGPARRALLPTRRRNSRALIAVYCIARYLQAKKLTWRGPAHCKPRRESLICDTQSPFIMMKNLFIAAVLLLSSIGFAQSPTTATAAKAPFAQKDTNYWIDNFRQLRDAIYQKNIAKTRAFFEFPVAQEGNEIWYVATPNQSVLPDKIKPFTDKDFTKYYHQLFSKGFIKAILKVKTEDLYHKGEYTTPAVKEGNAEYVLYSSYDKAEHMLQLSLAAKFDLNNEDDEAGESGITYFFKVTEKGHLIFSHIAMAG